MTPLRVGTVVIGAGQAGLAAGYHLRRRRIDFVILEAAGRVGSSWRQRWDSLRLFTPACFDQLPGMPFPAPRHDFPTKDEMADYLERYARWFDLPVELGIEVLGLDRQGARYLVTTTSGTLEADHVIVATGAHRTPYIPAFVDHLHPSITHLHSSRYRNPEALGAGSVLVVGAGNSGSEIALDLADRHRVLLAGRNVGQLPTVPGCTAYRLLRRLRTDTRVGRWVAARRAAGGDPVVRVKRQDLRHAGVELVPRMTGTSDGRPVIGTDRTTDVDHVVWATGFVPDFSWIRLPILDTDGTLLHHRGTVPTEPGLHFLGLPLQSTIVSDLVGGVGADAEHVADELARSQRGVGAHPRS